MAITTYPRVDRDVTPNTITNNNAFLGTLMTPKPRLKTGTLVLMITTMMGLIMNTVSYVVGGADPPILS